MKLEYLIPLAAYLLGSVPFGYILVRVTQGADIRATGSGNIGATNVFRRNRWAGILTLLLDAGKGYAAVVAAAAITGDTFWHAVAAVAAVAGHIFTLFLGFKGGKGVATGCGAFLAISPPAVGAALVLFVLTALLTRFISLASIVAASVFPLLAWLFGEPRDLVLGAVASGILIVAKHHENIRRLLSGAEHKFAPGDRP